MLRASDTGQSRANDQQILVRAISEGRILVTLDEHFGDWAVLPLDHHHGVVRLKVHPTTSANVVGLLVPFLDLHPSEAFENHLVIVSIPREKWIRTA